MSFTPKLIWEGGISKYYITRRKSFKQWITIGYVTGGKFSFSDAIKY